MTRLGISFDTVTLIFPGDGFDPMYIIKFDSSGNSLWGKALASGGDDKNGIALGNIIVYMLRAIITGSILSLLGCDSLDRDFNREYFSLLI
jgi:hypothetical protein